MELITIEDLQKAINERPRMRLSLTAEQTHPGSKAAWTYTARAGSHDGQAKGWVEERSHSFTGVIASAIVAYDRLNESSAIEFDWQKIGFQL